MKTLIKFLAATIFVTAIGIETLKRYNKCDALSAGAQAVTPYVVITKPAPVH